MKKFGWEVGPPHTGKIGLRSGLTGRISPWDINPMLTGNVFTLAFFDKCFCT